MTTTLRHYPLFLTEGQLCWLLTILDHVPEKYDTPTTAAVADRILGVVLDPRPVNR